MAVQRRTAACDSERIVVDVAGLQGVSADFLKFLMCLRRDALSSNAKVHLVHVKPELQHVLEVTGVARLITYEREPL
jgi:anti-anti-sigma regulatory factor